jgi:hypothetical protein
MRLHHTHAEKLDIVRRQPSPPLGDRPAMIEAAARAIARSGFLDGRTDDDGWDDLEERRRQELREAAELALTAVGVFG